MNGMPIVAQYPTVTARPRSIPVTVSTTPLVWLMSFYVFFLPMQLGGETVNFAPSDLFLGAALLFCLLRLRLVKSAWGVVHMAFILMFVASAGVSIYLHGTLNSYVLVKIVGLFTLFASYLCLTTSADSWHTIGRFIRIFIVAASLHSFVAVMALSWGFSADWMNYGDR